MSRMPVWLVAIAIAFPAGCGGPPATPSTDRESEAPGHSHGAGKMMLVDAGPYHAALTAHLSSKEGNELDAFFETADAHHTPVPLSVKSISGEAETTGGAEHDLEFLPAPPDERKGDPEGKCSHFVAKAGWMKPADVLTVTLTVEIDGKARTIAWTSFNPKTYAHFEE